MAQTKIEQYISCIDIDKKLISNINNGILILDDKLTIYYFNKWLELHTKLKEQDVLYKQLDTIFTTIKTKTLIRKIKTALNIGSPTFYIADISKYLIPIKINQIKASNYTYMQQDVSIIPFDKTKKIVALIITDQTNISNTNSLLKANINKVNILNNELVKERDTINKKVLLIKIDTNNIIQNVSQAYLELIKYDKNELLQHDYFEYLRPFTKEKLLQDIKKYMKSKTVFKFEQKFFTKRKQEIWLKNTLLPEYDNFGNHIGFIFFKENITASKKLQLHQKKLLVHSRLVAKREMISMIAHQWRQPLSVITANISNLIISKELDTLTNETIDKSYEQILTTISSLSDTIDFFRDFFNPCKSLSETYLNELTNKSVYLLKNDFKKYNINYIEEMDQNLKIVTYKNELVQTLMSILKNSLDALLEIKIKNKNIILKAFKKNNYINIMIIDNAGSINKETLNQIFEPYFSTKSKNGSGLGLYMCKIIVKDYLNGHISLSSHKNETKVLIKLPLTIH
ncbi:MAG: hypothetical protein COB17_07070 [Sulfurimonas sp.]|nr:MAG: hypothetical protein COB17_07070 [Sulfurimonas sp.]